MMIWPWQRRSSPAATADSSRVPAAGWAFLPPLQRQLSDEPPLTLAPTFESWLPTRAAPQRMGAMGHLVTAGAPAGTVAGTTAQLGAPVQRAVATDLTLRPPTWDRPRTGPTPDSTVARIALGGGASVDSGTGSATRPPAHAIPLSAVPDDSRTEGAPDADSSTSPQPADVLPGDSPDVDVLPEDVRDAEAANAGAAQAEAGLLGGLHPSGTLSPAGTHAPGTGTGTGTRSASLQRHKEDPRQPTGTTTPSMPSPGMRRLGLGAPLKPPAQSAMPTLQRADGSITSAPVPPSVAAPSPATQSHPSASHAGGTETTAAAPASPEGGRVDEDTAETNVGTIASMPAQEVLAMPDTAPRAPAPPYVASNGDAPLPLPQVQMQRSGNEVGERSAIDTTAVDTAAVDTTAIDTDAIESPAGSGPATGGLAAYGEGIGDEQSLPAVGRAQDVPDGGDASDVGRRSESSTGRADARAVTAQTVPLVAQRALAPMLSPVTMARPVQRQHPRASVLVDTDEHRPAPATTSLPPGRAASADAPAPLPDTRNAPRGGLVNWLQRLVGTEGNRPSDTASAAAGGDASGLGDARFSTLLPSTASRSTRAHRPGGGPIDPRADAGPSNAASVVQRAVVNVQASPGAAEGATPGRVASRLQRLTGRSEPESPDDVPGMSSAGLPGMAGTRPVTALPPATPRQVSASGDDGRTDPGADAGWTGSDTSTGRVDSTDRPGSTGSTGRMASAGWTSSTPVMQRSVASAASAPGTPTLLSGAPLSRAPARVDVQAVAPPTLDRAPMPVAVAPLGSLEQQSAGTASADAPVPDGSTPATVQRAEAPESASAPVPLANPGEPPVGGEAVPAAGTSSGSLPGAAAAATAAVVPVSPAAIETLAGQLYGPLVRRLKAELLLDRERRGLRIDGV